MSQIVETAVAFARALANGDGDSAHGMLSPKLSLDIAASALVTEYNVLADEMGGVTGVGQGMVILEDWPDKAAEDRAMVYVPLEGDVFSEAITVAVSEIDGTLCISSLEWGRP